MTTSGQHPPVQGTQGADRVHVAGSARALLAYDAAVSAHHPDRVAFFPNRSGGFYNPSIVGHWFAELLVSAGGDVTSRPGSSPRPYDLRHAHVVENINRWAHASRDPQALVPYLSLHLGHANPEDTWYYFHPDLRRLASGCRV